MRLLSLRTMSAIFLGATAAVGVIWEGCAIYDGSLLVSADAGVNDAQPDMAIVPDSSDGCNHARWPQRPTADDDASTPDIDFYAALQSMDFGVGDGGAGVAPGLDLDDTCTCPGPDSCQPFGEAGSQCDLEGGVDNGTGMLLKGFAGTGSTFFDQDKINAGVWAGNYGALIHIRGYNGQANDTKVQLSFFLSDGTQGVETDAGPTIPKFDGTDVWTIDPKSLLGGVMSDAGPVAAVAYDLNAYVTNYTLVANISDMPLTIGAAGADGFAIIELSGAIVVAKLTPVGNSFSLNGVIAGRWETRTMLTSLQVLHDPFDIDAALCGNDPVYQLVKERVCALQDIASNVLDDNKGAPCNALSLGIGFTMLPAHYGTVFGFTDGGNSCGPQWTDDCLNAN